jgi:hypothetical protein
LATVDICSACNRPIHENPLWLDAHAVLVTDQLGKTELNTIDTWRPFHRGCLQARYPFAILPPLKPPAGT